MNLLRGKQTMNFNEIPEGISSIASNMFTGQAIPIGLDDVAPDTIGEVENFGSDFLQNAVKEVSSWVKWRPSFIQTMKYFYHVKVTHTCPPFVTIFQGSMEVQNNWSPTSSRLGHYIGLQKGFLDVV
tara:strand:- start:645 stop:1025 length:381 start_codon:yes stop_codon:yes gene_type:complete